MKIYPLIFHPFWIYIDWQYTVHNKALPVRQGLEYGEIVYRSSVTSPLNVLVEPSRNTIVTR
jgi:hypothetical protein